MPRRRGNFPVVRQGPRRLTEWLFSADSDATTLLGAGTAVLDQSVSGATIDEIGPATIVRTRGELWVASDQASSSEEPFGAMGFAVVSEQARVAGVTAVPTPITEEGSEKWFIWQSWLAYFATGQGVTWQRYSFDSKAMRKIADGDAIVVVLENASAVFGAEFILKFRMLVKLH